MVIREAVTEMTGGQRTRVGVFDAGLRAAPGLEVLREIHARRSPQPPIHYWTGRRLVALQHAQIGLSIIAPMRICPGKMPWRELPDAWTHNPPVVCSSRTRHTRPTG